MYNRQLRTQSELLANRAKDFNIFGSSQKELSTERLFKIAQNNPKGFTVDIHGNDITKGYAVALKLTQNSFGVGGAKTCVDLNKLCNNKFMFGGWLHNGSFYFDLVLIFTNIQEAFSYAVAQDQFSFYDLTNNTEFKLSNF